MSDVITKACDALERLRENGSISAAEQVLYDFIGRAEFRQLRDAGVTNQTAEQRAAVRALQEHMARCFVDHGAFPS